MDKREEEVITYDEALRRKVERRVAPAFMGNMMKISSLISWAQGIKDKFGDTCVYVCDLSWGAVALNHESDDKKRLSPDGSSWVSEPNFNGSPDELTRLQSENAKLTEIVGWYADNFCELGSDHECCGKMLNDDCCGCKARAALAAGGK